MRLAPLVVGLLLPLGARAEEVVLLVDNTKIVGDLEHFYDGMLTLKLPNGARMQLPREKVKQVSFALPKPRPELGTPQKTFERLRNAALKGDIETYVDAHSAYYQMFLNHQVTQISPDRFKKQLREQWGNAQLQVVGSEIKDGLATLKVRRKDNGQTEDGEFRFVKENREWKMILPL